ncbi:hypothetical protein GCM10011521_12040 [Arenimonas soli]|uniref:Polysaccharide pyruvyl transferase domain-containing protein n=1 Tax=Arenimonas soli TaxID=2269504 RepID=A0ABQ1HFU4_9GAMM|nr:polysaccharide pyruvyl transferase family protein [Arenimonas soli]GGA75478.1 hypothetical protein GCM10011521_12040 [Arenimonas soli]
MPNTDIDSLQIRRDADRPRVRIIGDHSAYHCGSAAAFEAILASCRKFGHITPNEDSYEILVVNGEGSMHHDSTSFRKKMAEIRRAIDTGKKVYLVNTVWQENPSEHADLLRRCERVTVRESMSQAELAAIGVVSDVCIDQSFFLDVAAEGPMHDFGGTTVLTDFYSRDLATFARITTQWTRTVPYVQMHEWDWSTLVRSLRTAGVLFTGRHHAVYAACRARTPFIALKGNTHKIEGLIATSGVDIPVFDSYPEALRALRSEAWRTYDYAALFGWMERQEPWRP